MQDNINKIIQDFSSKLASVNSINELQILEQALFGKKGELTIILKSLSTLDPEARKEIGAKANKVKIELQEAINAKSNSLKSSTTVSAKFDLTQPGIQPRKASLHPITRQIYELNEAFLSLGFEVYEEPEITSEAVAFDALNFPTDHPARESMDTYWLKGFENNRGKDRLCLRPHLTGASIGYMLKNKPPFKFVYPGQVFRNESTDASHERAFFQYEALIVDKEVPFSSVRLLVNTILKKVFGREVKTRMRAGFFPFVEPGFEIDMQCLVCEGKGCSVCGRTGWVEMMPGGPPHPNVLKAGGIDPKKWQGAYINVGLDRMVMMKYGIDDVRLFHSGDLRFLHQF